MQPLKLSLDINDIRAAIAQSLITSLGLKDNQVMEEEPETQNSPRPQLPYMSFKITVPGFRYGDDSKLPVVENNVVTTKVKSQGPRKMTVVFNSYAESHEAAYNLMMLWQCALEEETLQEYLESKGIAVLLPGAIADLSALLNTGYEGRAHMDCQFGFTVGVTSDLGEIQTIPVSGQVSTPEEIENVNGTY